MGRATLRSLLARKLRLALTAVSVVLGVAFVAGTFVLTDTVRRSIDTFFATLNAGADVSVRAASRFADDQEGLGGGDRPAVPAALLDTLVALDGVAEAAGTLVGFAQVVAVEGPVDRPSGPSIGTVWIDRPRLNPLTLRQGRPPAGDGEVLVDRGTAERLGVTVGGTVQVLSQVAPARFEVVGVAELGDGQGLGGISVAAFGETTARRVLGRADGFDSIEVAADDGLGPPELRRRVAAALGPGLEAVTGQAAAAESAARVQRDLGFFGTLLLVFAGVSLFVGAFIILNTFQILVAQRTRELGLFRALGATGGQIRRSVLAESVVVGLVGSAGGLGLGVLVAGALQALLRQAGVDLPDAATVFRPRTAVISIAVGLVVTVASAALPARRAARVTPMAAITDGFGGAGPPLRRRTVVGLVVSAGGFALLLAGTAGAGNGAANVGLGAGIGFVGASLVAPAVTRPLAWVLGAPLLRVGISGRLGRENAARNPRRTASTAAALMVGLALVSLVTIFAASARRSTSRIIDEVFQADLVLAAASGSDGFSPEVTGRARGVPGVQAAAAFRDGTWRDDRGEEQYLSAIDAGALERVLDLKVSSGRLADLGDGGVALHEDAAADRGLAVGDALAMEFARTGTRSVRVDAVFSAEQLTGEYILSLEDYEANFADQLDSFVMVELAAAADRPAVRAAIEAAVAEFRTVEVQDQQEFKDRIADETSGILNLFYALLALAVVIALVGIVNTLALSVIERTRELGLLRAVGMARRQVRSMVRGEGVIIATLGAVLGLVVGLVVALAMLAALRDQGLTETAVPGGRLAAFVVAAAGAGVGAAVLPARRAARTDVLAAIAHE